MSNLRNHPISGSAPIRPETYERLLIALDEVYPGKWRRAVDVCPVAVNKTIDNEADALETILRIEERPGRIAPEKPPAPDLVGELVEALRILVEALRILADSTPWEHLEAWYPAMSPTERAAFDTVRAALTRAKEQGR